MAEQAGLYGIKQSNRNFADAYYWGKNQFNSAFPAALACYMRDQGHAAMYIRHASNQKTSVSELPFSEVFGSPLSNKDICFSFEDTHVPFGRFVHDTLKPIDLILKNGGTKECIRPLEIKLTVIPDNSTSERSDEDFGAELVIRSPTMRYMAMSMAASCQDSMGDNRHQDRSRTSDWKRGSVQSGKVCRKLHCRIFEKTIDLSNIRRPRATGYV